MKILVSYFKEADRKSAWVLLSATALTIPYLYQGHHSTFLRLFGSWFGEAAGDWLQYAWQFGWAQLCFVVAPLLVILYVLKESPKSYGVQTGDWRFGLKVTVVAMVALLPLLWINAGSPEFQAEYPLTKVSGRSFGHFFLWELTYLVYYIAWEFFFRGYMQFGTRERYGVFGAMMFQTIASTIMHIGKPEGETFAALLAGPLFGALAFRTESVLYCLLIHWYVGAMTDYFCLVRGGMAGW